MPPFLRVLVGLFLPAPLWNDCLKGLNCWENGTRVKGHMLRKARTEMEWIDLGTEPDRKTESESC